MQSRRVMMLVANRIDIDGRVQRSARSLAANGYEVTVVARAANGGREYELDGYHVVELSFEAAPPVKQRWRFTLLWEPLLRSERPDIVHLHDHQGLGVAVSALGGSARLVYDAHEYAMGKRQTPYRREQLRAYLLANVPAVDAVITVSEALAEALTAELPLPAPPILIHNTPPIRDALPAPYLLRDEIGVDRETPVVVYAGGVNVHRRLDTVMRAVARLPEVHLALVVLEAGRISMLREECAQLGIDARVHFPPAVPPEALVSLLSDADAGVIPLERYGNGDVALPNKLFEYLHAGLPMVVSDSPQVARFVGEHGLGEIASVEDVDAWSKSLERVLANPAAYTGDREHLCREWSWEAQETRLLELYERLA